MLVLTLRDHEELTMQVPGHQDITVKCLRHEDGRLSLGITAEPDIKIVRGNAAHKEEKP